jgi:BASS family bile acid:Na+ symporter
MFLLTSTQQILVVVFLVTAMLSIGLQAAPGTLRTAAYGRGLLLRTLLANFVIVPVLGILIARFAVADSGIATAFVLLACTPGGISALQFTTKAKGAAAYAGVTAVLLSLLAVVFSPLMVAVVLPDGVEVVAPRASAFGFLLAFLVLPLVLGMIVKAKADHVAATLAKGLGLISAVTFVVLVVMLLAPRNEAMQKIGGQALGLLLLLLLVSMIVGWLLGGPETGTREVLASATSMRNAALALAIGVTLPNADAVLPALIAFSALMVPPNLILTIVCLIANKRRARRQESAGPGATAPARQK